MLTNDKEVALWVMQPIGRWNASMTAIGEIKDGKLIAGIAFESQNKQAMWGHQRIDSPPSKQFWMTAADFIYNQAGCKRFSAVVDVNNEKAIALNKHIGFVIEATLKDAGDTGDVHIMTLWREHCRFLNWIKK
jgi:RimJ/RimL family protein N-acetyltransferase